MAERKRWTPDEDQKLAFWGACVGNYGFVAEHDLGRTREEGERRIGRLRRTKPDFVKEQTQRAKGE